MTAGQSQTVGCALHGALLLLTAIPCHASIPLPSSPSWSSTSNDYSTGGGFWDIDTNGYVDFGMSNGNDMALNSNAVYFNHGGILEDSASWRSADRGNFGHMYLGDVDNDGLMDMAVAYLGPAGDHRARVYRNIGGTLSSEPWWISKDSTRASFDCCLGDVNNDGWLDLAISGGDAYGGISEPLRIYFNHDGVLDSLPGWQSTNPVIVDALRFADLNNDGRLDLIANGGNRLYVYYHSGDSLEGLPSWVDTIAATQLMGVRMAVGDYDNDLYKDVAVVHNGQIATGNGIRIYHNTDGTLEKPAALVLQRRNQYSSCVAWGDVDGDFRMELAAGGWWEPLVVYDNSNGLLDTLPSWSWQPATPGNLVCENVTWADIRNVFVSGVNETSSGDGVRKLFPIDHLPVQEFSGIEVNSVPLPRSDYCFDPLVGYYSLRNAPPPGVGNILVHYSFPEQVDLGVTNWEPDDHNYVFLNTAASAVAAPPTQASALRLDATRSLFNDMLQLTVQVPARTTARLELFSVDGRNLGRIKDNLRPGRHTLTVSGESLTAGAYFARLACSNSSVCSRKLIKIQ